VNMLGDSLEGMPNSDGVVLGFSERSGTLCMSAVAVVFAGHVLL
jgi:hypothetical protein